MGSWLFGMHAVTTPESRGSCVPLAVERNLKLIEGRQASRKTILLWFGLILDESEMNFDRLLDFCVYLAINPLFVIHKDHSRYSSECWLSNHLDAGNNGNVSVAEKPKNRSSPNRKLHLIMKFPTLMKCVIQPNYFAPCTCKLWIVFLTTP